LSSIQLKALVKQWFKPLVIEINAGEPVPKNISKHTSNLGEICPSGNPSSSIINAVVYCNYVSICILSSLMKTLDLFSLHPYLPLLLRSNLLPFMTSSPSSFSSFLNCKPAKIDQQ